MNNLQNTFCSIAAEENGRLNPYPNNQNLIETFYYCATFDGVNDVWGSDLAGGKIGFRSFTSIFDYNRLVGSFGK